MSNDEYESMREYIRKDGLRMKRDKMYAHKVYMGLGIMTKKGNLTRKWQQIRKLTGFQPRHMEAIRRALA